MTLNELFPKGVFISILTLLFLISSLACLIPWCMRGDEFFTTSTGQFDRERYKKHVMYSFFVVSGLFALLFIFLLQFGPDRGGEIIASCLYPVAIYLAVWVVAPIAGLVMTALIVGVLVQFTRNWRRDASNKLLFIGCAIGYLVVGFFGWVIQKPNSDQLHSQIFSVLKPLSETTAVVPLPVLWGIPVVLAAMFVYWMSQTLRKRRDRQEVFWSMVVFSALYVWLTIRLLSTQGTRDELSVYLLICADILAILLLLFVLVLKAFYWFTQPPLGARLRVKLSNGTVGWVEPEKFNPDTMEEL